MAHVLEPQLIEALTGCLSDAALLDQLSQEYHYAASAAYDEMTRDARKVSVSQEDLQKRKDDLTAQASNLLDYAQQGSRNEFLVQRLDSIKVDIESIDRQLAVLGAPLPETPTREAATKLVEGKLAGIVALLDEDSESAWHRLREHLTQLVMRPVDTPDGPRCEVTGQINLFPTANEGVELEGSFKRTCKLYTSISVPFKAMLIVRANEWKRLNREKTA
jgi:hypothetical protein